MEKYKQERIGEVRKDFCTNRIEDMKMQYKRVLTESIQETLIYYINGRRFRANAIREGKNIYKIILMSVLFQNPNANGGG